MNSNFKANRSMAAGTMTEAGVGLVSDDGLENDLPRFCMEPDMVESNRALAWLNAICFVYLLIGIIGLNPPPISINKKSLAQEEAVPTVIEPLITPVQQVGAANPQEVPNER